MRLARLRQSWQTKESEDERKAFRRRFKDLSRGEARALAGQQHPSVFLPDVWAPLRGVERRGEFLDSYSARVTLPNGTDAVAVSSLPLRTRNDDGELSGVDLDLVNRGGALRPENPLVDTVIPARSSGPVQVGEIGFELGGDVPVQLENNRAFYADAGGEDIDLMVMPTPSGIESFAQIRSVDAPEEVRMPFRLPAGAELRRAGDTVDAALEIVRDGEVLATVSVPSAVDSQQRPVPVAYRIEGDDLVMTVAHRSGDFAMPIMLDPTVAYPWNGNPRRLDAPGWGVYQSNPASRWCSYFGDSYLGYGQYTYGRGESNYPCAPTQYSPYEVYEWNYYGEYWRGSTAFVEGWDEGYNNDVGSGGTCHYSGTYSIGLGRWETFSGNECWTVWNNIRYHRSPGTPPNYAVFGTVINGSGLRHNFTNQLWGATVFVSDRDNPTVEQGPRRIPDGWTKDTTFDITARDPGIGVDWTQIRLSTPGQPDHLESRHHPCSADPANHCPRADTFAYATNNMPEGIRTVSAQASDLIRVPAPTQLATIKIDRTPPLVGETDVEGTLKPEDRQWVGAGEQSLFVDAADALSGVVSAELTIDGVPAASTATQPCPAGGCSLEQEFSVDLANVDAAPQQPGHQPLSEGQHQAKVVVTDGAGNPREIPWTLRYDRTPPQLVIPPGPLKNADGQTLDPDQTYAMEARATDGNNTPLQAGMGRIDISVDDEFDDESFESTCPAGGCSAERSYELAAKDYADGPHTVRVTAVDRAGNQAEETITVNSPPPPPAECQPPIAPTVFPNFEQVEPTVAETVLRSAAGLPEAFTASTIFDLGGDLIQPGLTGGGMLPGGAQAPFTATGTVSPVRIDWTSTTGATLNLGTDDGPVCMSPTATTTSPSRGAMASGSPVAVFANSAPATDFALRPGPVGAETLVQLRGPTAPRAFSWRVDLQPDLALRQLEDGSVGIVRPAAPDVDPAPLSQPVPGAATLAEQRTAISNTDLGLSQATDLHDRLSAPIGDDLVAVVRRPWAKDSQGQPVATSLSFSGSTITMSLPTLPQPLAYPVVSNMQVSSVSGSDDADTARDFTSAPTWDEDDEAAFEDNMVESQGPEAPGPAPTAEAHEEDALSGDYPDDEQTAFSAPVFLPDGDLETPEGADPPDDTTRTASAAVASGVAGLNIGLSDTNPAFLRGEKFRGIARKNFAGTRYAGRSLLRVFVPWNYVAVRAKVRRGDGLKCERRAVARWDGTDNPDGSLKQPGFRDIASKLNRAEVMVVFSGQVQSCPRKQKAPTTKRYRDEIAAFMNESDHAFVDRITAWNEPNFEPRLRTKPKTAARFWKRASAFCRRSKDCASVPAGVFAGLASAKTFTRKIRKANGNVVEKQVGYIKAYKVEIGRRDGPSAIARKNWPLVWSFHPWQDLRIYSAANRDPIRDDATTTRKFRSLFSQDGEQRDGGYVRDEDYRYVNRSGVPQAPRIWNTETGGLYRLACKKVVYKKTKVDRNDRCRNRGDGATLLLGKARQTQASAFLLRTSIMPMEGPRPGIPANPVKRLYYFTFVDSSGYGYVDGQGFVGWSGRCKQVQRQDPPRTVPRCDPDDSGAIGSDADDFRIVEDEGLILNKFPQRNGAPDPPRSASGEARGTYCLLRDRRAMEVKRGRIIRRTCDFEAYQP